MPTLSRLLIAGAAVLGLGGSGTVHLASTPQVPGPGARPPAAAAVRVEPFPLAQVRLLGGPFARAQELNARYIRSLEVDRLLAPFRTEAGLAAKGERYPNWESTGLQGHTAGHYLTALAQAWAATADAEAKRRLDYMVDELAACQRANGNGYVGAVPGSRKLWTEIAAGTIKAESFGLNGAWVPWYNLHKLFAGLRDAYLIGGNAAARDVLVRLADWAAALVASLTDDQVQQMLRAEHGGMNEVLADVSAITGDRRYLALAARFSDRDLFAPLTRGEDTLTGKHANTQIPKVIGYERIAGLGGDPAGAAAARYFWDRVVGHRSVAFGGNSVREHFNPGDDFTSMLVSREGPETCNTYNMLRLTERLFARTAEARYADYYERALYNHILSTQHPDHGGYVYFTPIRPRHYRVYSQPTQTFWCCVGTGLENHGKYGAFVYAHAGDDVYVNLFVASELRWPERGLTLRQETSFPDTASTQLRVGLREPRRFALRVRHPGWVEAGGFRVRVNGMPWPASSTPASYAAIDRDWRDGDRVDVDLPMRTTIESLPGDRDYVAVLHGPILLAAKTEPAPTAGLVAGDGRMAHVSPGPYLPLDGAPMLVGDPTRLADDITPVPGRPLTFTARGLIQPRAARDLELVPFFRVHDSRYMLYWRTATPTAYTAVVGKLRAEEKAQLALERRTLDRVVPGEQQPEVEHGVRGDGATTGVLHGRPFREATGFFSYDLTPKSPKGPFELRVTYYGNERGRRFAIFAGTARVADVALDGRTHDQFVDVTYAIPDDAVREAGGGPLTIRFVAEPGSRTAAVYDVRLLRP
jgi:DUF1680 family protein